MIAFRSFTLGLRLPHHPSLPALSRRHHALLARFLTSSSDAMDGIATNGALSAAVDRQAAAVRLRELVKAAEGGAHAWRPQEVASALRSLAAGLEAQPPASTITQAGTVLLAPARS